jgi:hypothetical protein
VTLDNVAVTLTADNGVASRVEGVVTEPNASGTGLRLLVPLDSLKPGVYVRAEAEFQDPNGKKHWVLSEEFKLAVQGAIGLGIFGVFGVLLRIASVVGELKARAGPTVVFKAMRGDQYVTSGQIGRVGPGDHFGNVQMVQRQAKHSGDITDAA